MTQKTEPRHPEITVRLTGHSANAFMIVGRVASALRRAGVDADEVTEFREEAMSSDYDNVLRTAMRWVEVT